MEEQAEAKNVLRRQMRTRRKALSPEARKRASEIICAKLLSDGGILAAIDPLEGGGAVAVYLASPDELDLSNFIREMLDRGVTVVSPRWNGETYALAKIKGLDDANLRRGPMNILEPAEAEIVEPSEVAAWIVPGLAFTQDGKRLGYGGGWYDRLLAAANGTLKIGVAHEFQIVDDLPHEPHDILLDRVVTPNLDDRHLEFTETPDGFCASISADSLHKRRVSFILSLLGLSLFPILLLVGAAFQNGMIDMPTWAVMSFLLVPCAAIAISGAAMLNICNGPEVAEIEVKGEEGVCRRRFLGLIQRRTIRFRWGPWSKAYPFGNGFYSARESQYLSVVEGGVEQVLFATYDDTASKLSIRMNLAHHVDPEKLETSAEAILTALPRGMRIIRDGLSETMEVKVHSLKGLGSITMVCIWLGIVAYWAVRWNDVLMAMLSFVWTLLSLVIAYHALWTLFGKHRLTISDKHCDYEARLGPRVKRKSFTLGQSPYAASFPGKSLRVLAADGNCHYCFDNLPPRCYLPLIVFVWHR